MLSHKQIQARERRLSAVHEAGHLVIARHLGVAAASAWIAPNENAGPEEKTWLGQMRVIGLPARRLSRRMIGVAGHVAVWAWMRADARDYFPDGLSDSDWRITGDRADSWGAALLSAASRVRTLLDPDGGPLWPDLIAESRRLIVESRQLP